MKLFYKKFGIKGEPLIFLHGIFGMGDNWLNIAKKFEDTHTTYLVDLRNHGQSPHADAFNYDVMADDVVELLESENINSCYLLGHSMGGKVAMQLACKYPKKVKKLLVIDIAPKYYKPHHQHIIKAFNSVDLSKVTSRNVADEMMQTAIKELPVRQFLLKNLYRNAQNTYVWRLNLHSIISNIEEVGKKLDENYFFDGDTIFIGGSLSNYILKDDEALINKHFKNATIQWVENAGHWVHADQPEALTKMLNKYLL